MQERAIKRSGTKAGGAFPIKILVTGLTVSVLLFAGVGTHMWGSYQDLQAAQHRNMRLQELTGTITYLHEVLTMSARMNAVTGATAWEARYLRYEPQLDAAIQEAHSLAPSAYVSDAAVRTDAANVALVDMEHRSFELVRAGNAPGASALLASPQYEQQKQRYAQGNQEIATSLQASGHHSIDAAQRQWAISIAFVAVPLFLVVWIVVLLSMNKHVRARRAAEEALRENELRYRTLASLSPVGIFRSDPEGENVYTNKRACEIMGITPEEALGEGWVKNLHPDDKERVFVEWQEARASGVPFQSEYRFVHPDGIVTWIYGQTATELNARGETVGYVGTITDITEHKRMEQEIRLLLSITRAISESPDFNSALGVALSQVLGATGWDVGEAWAPSPDGQVLECCTPPCHTGREGLEVFCRFSEGMTFPPGRGLPGRVWSSQQPEWMEDASLADPAIFTRTGGAADAGLKAALGVPIVIDGRVLAVLNFFMSESRAEDRHMVDVVSAVAAQLGEVVRRKQMEEALREQARRDSLTCVLNHAAIVEELRRIIASGDTPACALAMVDVDGMKAMNDTHGHHVGDEALRTVSRALERRGAVVGRYGGDEFIVVLPGFDDGQAEQYRREVADEVAQTRLLDPDTKAKVPLSVTIGFAFYPQESEAIVDLINLADSAMYAQRRERPISPDSRARRSPADDQVARMVGEIVPLLTSPGDIQTKLHFVAQRLLLGSGHDAVNAVLFSPQPGGPALSSTVARVDEETVHSWDANEAKEGEVSTFRVLLEHVQRPFIIDDLAHDDRLSPSQRELLTKAGLQSGLVAPMIWQGQTLGALAVASKQPAAFGPAEAQLLSAVAGQVAAVVRMENLVVELQDASARLGRAHEETVMILAASAEAHDATTGQHLQHVQVLVEALARELGQSQEEARALGTAAALHDIGKLFVPDSVLASTGPLDNAGWELMKRHTTQGQQFLNGHPGFELAAAIARHHHERWDGAGYPDGLAGTAIAEAATIVTVADAFDAMTSGRPYSRPLSLDSSITEIRACSGAQFSPRVVDALLRLHERDALPSAPPFTQRAAA